MAKTHESFGDLEQTDGSFALKGVITGVAKPTFYQEKNDKNGRPFRMINFGVQVSKDWVHYLSINGMTQEKVYFYSKDDKKTISQDWKSRNSFRKEGYRLIGMNLGLEKTKDEKGNDVNDKKNLVPFDACGYINEHLKDGMSVFVRGKLEYSSFNNNSGELQRSVKLVPNQISLCKDVDFDEEDFDVQSDFTQTFVFMDMEMVKDGEEILGANVHGSIVNYNSIEQAEFFIRDSALGKNFKTLKPYTFIKTWGNLETERNKEEVASEDVWGSANTMEAVRSPYRKVFVITGADPKSMNREDYSESKMDKALQAMKKAQSEKEEFKTQNTSNAGTTEWGDTTPIEDDEETGW